MSASPYFYIEAYNAKTGNWEKVDIYSKNSAGEYVPVDLWPWNGSHDLFSIVGYEDSYDMPEFNAVHSGLPVNASQEMYAIVQDHYDEEINYMPQIKYFNVADAKLYLMKYPTVQDSDEMETWWAQHDNTIWEEVPKMEKQNPLKALIDRVESILEFWDEFWWINGSWSDIRIIYWVSR